MHFLSPFHHPHRSTLQELCRPVRVVDTALRATFASVLISRSRLVWAAVWGGGPGAEVVGVSGCQPGPLGDGPSLRAELFASTSYPPLRPTSGRVFPGLLPTIHGHIQQPVAGGHHLRAAARGPVGLEHAIA